MKTLGTLERMLGLGNLVLSHKNLPFDKTGHMIERRYTHRDMAAIDLCSRSDRHTGEEMGCAAQTARREEGEMKPLPVH